MKITASEWLNIYRGWLSLYPNESRYWLDEFVRQWKYSDDGAEYLPPEDRREHYAT
jgi:hypothetical protein